MTDFRSKPFEHLLTKSVNESGYKIFVGNQNYEYFHLLLNQKANPFLSHNHRVFLEQFFSQLKISLRISICIFIRVSISKLRSKQGNTALAFTNT